MKIFNPGELFRLMTFLAIMILMNGCSRPPYRIIPQVDSYKTSHDRMTTAIDSVVSKLHFEADKKNDSVVVLFKPPVHAWNSARIMEVRTRIQGDSILMSSMGEAYSNEGIAHGDANEYAYIFNSAVAQELSMQQGSRIYNRKLPFKRWDVFGALTLINTGLGLYYAYDTPFTGQFARYGALSAGLLDLLFLTMVFIPPSTEDRFRTAITPQGVGITGLTAGRLAIPALYFFNMEFYRDIQKTPYYFDMDQFRKRAEAGILVDF